MYDFNFSNGNGPRSGVILSGDTLFGMTMSGGANGLGNIFSVDTDGTNYQDLYDFQTLTSGKPDGSDPQGTILISGNFLYGMTSAGGSHQDGNIFVIQRNGQGYRDLFDFNDTLGSDPFGSVILIGSKLYGMTNTGGANDDGDIFSIDTSGNNFKDLYDFTSKTGGLPWASLRLFGGELYGTTATGGAFNLGVVFSVDTTGANYTDLGDFNGTNGSNPTCSLVLSDSVLYGTTSGLNSVDGSVFSIPYPQAASPVYPVWQIQIGRYIRYRYRIN